MSVRTLALWAVLAACHAGEALELPAAEPGERSALLAIEDPSGAVGAWAFDLDARIPPFSARSGSGLTIMFHRRSLAELFLDEGPLPLTGVRPLPAFDRARAMEIAGEWQPIDAVSDRLAELRLPAPSREECAAEGGFYLSEEAAAAFDCYASSSCNVAGSASCPPSPLPPTPPSPPRSFDLDPCPSGEWPLDVPAGAAYVRPGAIDGDGSSGMPFGAIAEASAAGFRTIALAKGDHGDVLLASRADLIGACIDTRIGSVEVRTASASITNAHSGAILAVDTASLTIDRVEIAGSLDLTGTNATLRRLRIESEDAGVIVRRGEVVAEHLAVLRAPIRGIELSSAAADLSDVFVGDSSTALLITGFREDPGLDDCALLAAADLSVTVHRAELGGLVRLSARATARISDVAVRASRDDRAFDVDGGSYADVRRIRIEGRNRLGLDINGTLLLEDADVRGAVLGLLSAARSNSCMRRVRITDARSLGACIDLESTTQLTDLDIARPSGGPSVVTTGNLCIDGTVEAGAGMRIHQLAAIDLSHFRIADSTGDAALVVYQLTGTRLRIRDGTVENNALLGAQIPEAPAGAAPFPLEQLMIRVRYANNGQTFGY